MERLKQKRSAAQTAFTKRANHLNTRANALDESDLKAEWRFFRGEHTRVTDAGFEYAMALREAEDDEAIKKADQIDEKITDCNRKFDEVKDLVFNSFWTRFAEEQIATLMKEACSALDQAEATDHLQISKMERELINKNLEREVYEVDNLVTDWMTMIPQAKLKEAKTNIRMLKKRQVKLCDKWAWQCDAWNEGVDEQKEQVRTKEDNGEKQGQTNEPPALTNPSNQNLPAESPITPTYSSYGALPNAASMPGQVHGVPSMYPAPLSFRPQITLERTHERLLPLES